MPSATSQSYHQQNEPVSQEVLGSQAFVASTISANVDFNAGALHGASVHGVTTSNAGRSGLTSQWLQNTVANELANNEALANAQIPSSTSSVPVHSQPVSSYSDQYESQNNYELNYHGHPDAQSHTNTTTLPEASPSTIDSTTTQNSHHATHTEASTMFNGDGYYYSKSFCSPAV